MNQKRKDMLLIIAFPIVLTTGILLIPIVPDYANHDLAARAVDLTARWFVGHILSAVAFGLGVLAVGAIDRSLGSFSTSLPSPILLFIAVGASLYAAGLGADGIGPIAVKSAGLSPTIFFDGSGWWVISLFVAGTLFFGIGLITMVLFLIQSGLLSRPFRYIAFISALVFAVAPAIPSGWALYGVAVAVIGVFVPIAISIGAKSDPPADSRLSASE